MNRKMIAFFGTMMVIALALAVTPAGAVCTDIGDTFGQTCGGLILSPTGTGAASPNWVCKFWGLNEGNIAVNGLNTNCDATNTNGADNGTWDDANNFVFDVDGTAGFFVSNWQAECLIEGCPTTGGSGQADKAMVFACTDWDSNGGYFMVSTALRNYVGEGCDDYDFSGFRSSGTETPRDLVMVPMPKPAITASANTGGGNRSATLAGLNTPSTGYYANQGTMTAATVFDGYKIYKQEAPFANPAPPTRTASRDRAGWTVDGGLRPFDGLPQTVNLTCPSNVNVYLAYSLVIDGQETAIVGGDSKPVACGPTIADPTEPNFKLIQKPAPKSTESKQAPRKQR